VILISNLPVFERPREVIIEYSLQPEL
jgi:hypothetical protein